MNISKNSWHFKLHKLFGTPTYDKMCYYNENVSLCNYFWSTVFAMIIATSLFSLLSMISIFLVINPLGTLFALYTGIGLELFDLGAGIFIIFFMSILSLFCGIFLSIERRMKVFPKWLPVDKWFSKITYFDKFRNKEKVVKPKEPNIVIEYIKAKKQKFCPMLKLSD